MKILRYIVPALALLLFACDTNDDGFYNTKYLQAANLVQVETQADYNVGSVIYVDATIPKLLPEPGQTTQLDIRETTGNAPTFAFSYYLEKKNASGEWDVVDVGTNFVDGGSGTAQIFGGVNGFLNYDTSTEQYEFRGGITLTAIGVYRLNFSNSTENYNKAAFNSNSTGNNIILNIFSTSASLDTSGNYNFVVD